MFAVETKNELSEVVGADAQEVGHVGDLSRPPRRLGRLDHGPDLRSGPAAQNAAENLMHGANLVWTRDHWDQDPKLGACAGVNDCAQLCFESVGRPQEQLYSPARRTHEERRGFVATEIKKTHRRGLSLQTVKDRLQECELLCTRRPVRRI